MNPRYFPVPLAFTFLILVNFPPSFALDDWFFTCTTQFQFGNLHEPFFLWRYNKKDCCGEPHPMNVNCEGNNRITIEILKAKYELLGYSMIDQILIVAEIDASSRFCLPNHNNSDPLHGLPCSIYGIIPLSLDCGHSLLPPEPNCSGTKFGYKEFHLPHSCILSAVVPIPPSLFKELGGLQTVAQHMKAQFQSEMKLDGEACGTCSDYGGVCGYDMALNKTRCYCQTHSNRFEICASCESGGQCGTDPSSGEFTCGCGSTPSGGSAPSEKKKKSNKPLIIGVSIGGACFFAITLSCCIFYCLRRKKKHPIESGSKDLSMSAPLSNQHMAAPSSNSSQTIPSNDTSELQRGTSYYGVQVFSYAELEKATNNFNHSRELGDGGFGTVYYGKLQDGREVAVKRLYDNNCKRVEQFMIEVVILAELHHKNLVKLYGCTSRRSQGLLLVYEYIPNGTVADHLHGRRAKSDLLSWPVRLRIAIETADALAHLHRSGVIHRDVKTNNILLDKNFTVKVADFGLSRLFPINVTHVSTAPRGTPGYVDPEYYQCYHLTDKSDVYSFGVVLIELISSLPAVDTNRTRQDINLSNMAVSRIQRRALDKLVDPTLGFDKDYEVRSIITSVAELAFRCLQQERDMRPSMEEVVEVLRELRVINSVQGRLKSWI